jgi:hypothetical protein
MKQLTYWAPKRNSAYSGLLIGSYDIEGLSNYQMQL